jgi:hypothetical protein
MFYEEEKKSNDKIIAEALAQILRNQIEIKRHFGLAKGDEYYGDCYHDREAIDELENID